MLIAPNHILGKSIFLASKIWILIIPVFWLIIVDKQKLSWSKPIRGGFGVAAGLGVAISIIIFIVYSAAGNILIQPQIVREIALKIGLSNPSLYIAGAAYWILINSVLEEYVWRWFVVSQCRVFMPVGAAIVISALGFTLHHIIALDIFFGWFTAAIASMGVFIGGAIWSWCYLRYRSIWPGYLSHAIVDIAVFAIGYSLIFK